MARGHRTPLWHSLSKNTGVSCRALLQGIFRDPEIEAASLKSPALAGRLFTTSATREAFSTQILVSSIISQASRTACKSLKAE